MTCLKSHVEYQRRASLRFLTFTLTAEQKTRRSTLTPTANCRNYFWRRRSRTSIANYPAITVGSIGISRFRLYCRLRRRSYERHQLKAATDEHGLAQIRTKPKTIGSDYQNGIGLCFLSVRSVFICGLFRSPHEELRILIAIVDVGRLRPECVLHNRQSRRHAGFRHLKLIGRGAGAVKIDLGQRSDLRAESRYHPHQVAIAAG